MKNILKEPALAMIAALIGAQIFGQFFSFEYREHIQTKWILFIMNGIGMALFFGLATKETYEGVFLEDGKLYGAKKWSVLFATVSGMSGAIFLFFLVASYLNISRDIVLRGFTIVPATDIVIAWAISRFIFGKGHPANQFLLAGALVDDFATSTFLVYLQWNVFSGYNLIVGFTLILLAMGICAFLRSRHIKNFWIYLMFGLLSWIGLYVAHLPQTLALVFVVPFMPHARHDDGFFKENPKDHSTLGEFGHFCEKTVDWIIAGFIFVNAGVQWHFSAFTGLTASIVFALLFGKCLFFPGGALFARGIGFPLPERVYAKELFVLGCASGVGLTVSLFMAMHAYEGALLEQAKMGAVLSAPIAALVSIIAARILRVGRFGDNHCSLTG